MKKSIELTPTEIQVLTAFRTMDARHKGEIAGHMLWLAKQHPERTPPKLRLIKGAPTNA